MDETFATIIFQLPDGKQEVDLDIPLHITANELIRALNEAYALHLDQRNAREYLLKSERPIALLRGDTTLSDFGIRNGSVIYARGEAKEAQNDAEI
ncbi:MAG: EsaB/YukD family protein [Oscillibacter sp.]|nr:EsaB/YukD family protein [Oscillibacter sp.]MBQ9618291.1 EsaB/YukD family protein [Oscillibacter sp.]